MPPSSGRKHPRRRFPLFFRGYAEFQFDVHFSPRTFPELVIDLAELWHYEEVPAAE